MRSGVLSASVSLDLGDPHRDTVVAQDSTEQERRGLQDRALEDREVS